jgi:hypothetical protein
MKKRITFKYLYSIDCIVKKIMNDLKNKGV